MEKDSVFNRARQSNLLWAIVIAAALVILFVVLSPYLIKIGIERTLTRAGNEQSKVSKIDLDLFSSTLVVRGLSTRTAGGKGIEVKKVTINFEIWPLFHKRLMINKLDIQDAKITAQQSKDGAIRIGGLMSEPTNDRTSQEKQSSSWLVNIDAINAGNTLIHYAYDKDGLALTAGIGSFEIEGFVYEKGRLAVDSVKLKETSAVRSVANEPEAGIEEQPLFNVSEVMVSDIQVADSMKVTIGPIVFRGANVLLRLMPDGGLYIFNDLAEALRSGDRPTGGKAGLSISSILVSEGSSVRFVDERISPPYRTTLKIDTARIENVESVRPEKPSAITIEGTIDEYTKVVVAGNIQLFSDRLTLDLTGKIEAFDLPPLTPYTTRHLGFDIDSGHMNTDIKVKVVEGEIEGISTMALSNLELSPGQEEGLKKLTAELTMPLDTALSLIRDKDNKIHLTLSAKGDIRDPTLKLGDMINQALGEAVQKAGISYLKYLFQPYGTYITVIELAAGLAAEAARVRLDPVFFEPGSVVLDAKVLQYLERAAGLMTDRPGIQMKLCGKAVENDRTVMKRKARTDERLLALARERASAIKDHLVHQHGITAERLFICNPEVDVQEDAVPRVELLL